MSKVIHNMYLYGDKDTNCEIGYELGLEEDALDNFVHALYEVCFEMETDTDTGESVILKVDGVEIRKPSPPEEDTKEKDDYLKRLGL